MTVRVVLADDHPIVRDGLSALLASIDGIEVVGVAATGREALRAAVTLKPDVLVMDIQMPDMDGVTAAREVARAAPSVGILMLTMFDDIDSVDAAMRAGAAGYVLKGASQQQIARAIHTVAAGDTILASGVAKPMLDAAAAGRSGARRGPLDQLTSRERDILELLATGLPTASIAERLGLAVKTVNNNLSTIFAKLGVAGRTEAALLARNAGLGDANSQD
jgi:DNA-binding NarL/FixJ family response regulator